jgi:hypothetical protein
MSDIDLGETPNEQIDSSDENQNIGEEDNSLGERKNQSNFKKLSLKLKQERKERERLQAEIARLKAGNSEEDDDDFDFEDDDSDETFSDVKSELFFLKNKDAELYREEMAELLEDNPKRKALPLSDLLDLAKAKFPKSTSKKTIDVSSGRSISASDDVSKIDASKLTPEQIEALSPAMYKKLFKK